MRFYGKRSGRNNVARYLARSYSFNARNSIDSSSTNGHGIIEFLWWSFVFVVCICLFCCL